MPKSIAYPEDQVFGIYALYADCPQGVDWRDQTAWGASSIYLDSVAFKYNGEYAAGYDLQSDAYKPYYWPFSGSLMFAGYSPHQGDSDGTIDSVNFILNTVNPGANPYFKIDFRQIVEPSKMIDLMWFDIKDVNNGKTVAKSDTPLNLQFKHALAKVSFEFVDNNEIYQLDSVILRGCINKATFYSGYTAGWLPDISQVENYELLSSSMEREKLNEWKSESLYIIPQYLDGIYDTLTGTQDRGLDVVLAFGLTDGFGGQLVEIPLKNYTDRWLLGYHYKYTVTVNADPIEFGSPDFTITSQIVAM